MRMLRLSLSSSAAASARSLCSQPQKKVAAATRRTARLLSTATTIQPAPSSSSYNSIYNSSSSSSSINGSYNSHSRNFVTSTFALGMPIKSIEVSAFNILVLLMLCCRVLFSFLAACQFQTCFALLCFASDRSYILTARSLDCPICPRSHTQLPFPTLAPAAIRFLVWVIPLPKV